MKSVIFPFAYVRAAQPASQSSILKNSFVLADSNEGFLDTLRKQKKQSNRANMIKSAEAFISSKEFIDSEQKVKSNLIDFLDILVNATSKNFDKNAREQFQTMFKTSPAEFIKTPEYENAASEISESIVAAAIYGNVSAKNKSLLTNLAKTLYAINLLTKENIVNKNSFSQAKFVLPPAILPLPLETTNLQEHRIKTTEAQKKAKDEKQKKILELNEDLKGYKSSIEELITLFDNSSFDDEARPTRAPLKKANRGFMLPGKDVENISAQTKAVVKKSGLETDEIDIAKTISTLEKKSVQTAQEIYSHSGQNARIIGPHGSVVFEDNDLPVLEMGTGANRVIGPCAPGRIAETNENVPITTNGKHDARVLGIVDLLVVEQELARYELGEIAHIENVLKSEVRDRRHKVTDFSEETITTETEETDTKENELSSTERFELQTEAQKVITESTSADGGATVSASYGVVDATANFNYANTNSLSETQRSASNFARETVSKAVSKLEKRSLERRTRRTSKEIVETNRHTFDNKDGGENITGIYRFVDKIYNAQIVNYGKRLMLEFIVPEPAAFLRHAMTMRPTDITIEKPEEPGYCSGYGRVFTPLKAQDINDTNYMQWSSLYGVEDITPPPSELIILGKAFSKDGQDLKKDIGNNEEKHIFWHAESDEIVIKKDYYPVSAKLQADFTYIDKGTGSETKEQKLTVQIGEKQVTFLAKNTHDTSDDYNDAEINIGIRTTEGLPFTLTSWGVMAFGLTVTILCRRTKEALQKWQIQTYNAIMNAYKDQLTRYNNTIETAKIRAGFTEISGTNPRANRETEKTELKRGCITLLTGQQFEGFDAMNKNVEPNGYPEIDFDEAAEEGKFISLFEQAFEWNNMTYLLYPYFWARKDQWKMLSQLTDKDPLFLKFLQAGSCRVNVPVRRSFEDTMLNYLTNNFIWDAEGSFINSEIGEEIDIQHLSLIEELKSQLNNMNSEGNGTISVTKDSKTITGMGTIFAEADENKRIVIEGKTYLIKSVDSETSIILKTPYLGDTEENLAYSFGGALYGDSWEVKVPTELVKLDEYEI